MVALPLLTCVSDLLVCRLHPEWRGRHVTLPELREAAGAGKLPWGAVVVRDHDELALPLQMVSS
jgi:hypothetical protein